MRDNRFWAVLIAIAFLVLWCAGVGVAYSSPAQEPLPDPAPCVQSDGARAVGIMGWGLVGVGFLGVALCVAFSGRSRRKRRPQWNDRRPARVVRSSYSSTGVRRYQQNIERRF